MQWTTCQKYNHLVTELENNTSFLSMLKSPIPEILYYVDELAELYKDKKDDIACKLRRLLKIFDIIEEAKELDQIEDKHRINNQYLPELKNLNHLFYHRWVIRNRQSKK